MYRRIAIVLSLAGLGLLCACDLSGLPRAETPTAPSVSIAPTSTPEAATVPQPTATTSLALLDTATTEPDSTATVVSEAPTSEVSPVATASDDSSSAEVNHELTEVESSTAQIRGLKPKSSVKAEFLSDDQLRANLTKEINTEYSPEEGHRDAMSLWLLRLINDPTIDLYKLQVDLLSEQVLGYYDQKVKQLYVRTSQQQLSPLARMTLSHEFTHALQDQYYDLTKLRPDKMETDQGNGVLALIEGDAVVSSIAYAQTNMTPDEIKQILSEGNSMSSKILDNAPRYIRDGLNFPYEQGPVFINALAAAQPGSFAGVDDALKDPPKSTEQVLHPEKYLGKQRDEPVDVTLPPLTSTLGAGWVFQDTDTLGEFDLRILLQENGADGKAGTPEPTAAPENTDNSRSAAAAAGWGGARYAIYQNGTNSVVALSTVWDTLQDATEFNNAMRQTLGAFKQSDGVWSDGKRFMAMKNSGKSVIYLAGTDSAAVGHALSAFKP